MRKTFAIILTALLVLTAFISCNQESIIDDDFTRLVTFDANGGKGTMEPQKITTRTVTALAENKFTLVDHHFTGWNTKADGSGISYGDGGDISITDDITLYAMWSHDKAFVLFDKNGGEGEMRTQIVLTNTATALNTNEFTREGFGFTGWNTKADGSGTGYKNQAEISIAEDTTLYAQWTDKSVTVTFYPNGGKETQYTQSVFIGVPTALEKARFTKVDNQFANWDTTASGSGHAYGDEAVVTLTEDLNLYAQWTHDTAKVTFNANGGTGTMADQVVDTNTPTKLNKETFTLTDYHFTNWDTTAEGTGHAYGDEANISISADTTLYAQWSHDTAKVTFNANGGTGTMADQVMDTKTETALNANTFTLTDMKFNCWNTKADGTGTSYDDKANITITADTTLYAQWIHATATIKFNANNEKATGTMADQVVQTKTETALNENAFALTDHHFVEWNTKADGSGTGYEDKGNITLTEDVTLYAIWEHDTATITFKPNGGKGEMVAQIVDTNTATELNENSFIKIGAEFVHWNTRKDDSGTTYEEKAEISIAEDIVLYAIWEKLPVIFIDENTTTLDGGQIYMIKTDVTNAYRLVIEGTDPVMIILPEDLTLTLTSGIRVLEGQSLVIEGEGTLVATGDEHAAGIGGETSDKGGTITILGGTINATGGAYAAGIGGGMYGEGGDVTILGGTVTAFGDSANGAVAIGHGYSATDDGTLEIGDGLGLFGGADKDHTEFLSGPVESYDGSHTAYMETKATTYVTVTFDANGGEGAMAAQSVPSGIEWKLDANEFTHETLFFAGWNTKEDGSGDSYTDQQAVTLEADLQLYAQWTDAIMLDDSYGGSEGKKLTGGLRYTIADDLLILPGRLAIDGTSEVTLILPEGKTLTLSKGLEVVSGQSLVIEGEGTLNATGEQFYAGIGGGDSDSGHVAIGGNVTINGGIVNTNGGLGAAGIGGSYNGSGGTVTINGGTVTATGGTQAAGIGGGNSGNNGGTVSINGGIVNAVGGNKAAGIGGGDQGAGGTVAINGGTVTATGGNEAVGIGKGRNGSSNGTLTIGSGYVLTGGSASADTLLLGPVDSETTYTGASHPRYMNVSTVSEIKDSTSAITLKSGVYTTDATDTDGVVVSERITVEGSVFLLLPDGKTLTASKGITVSSGNTLVIDKYGSSAEGTGKLIAGGAGTTPTGAAGIGGGGYNQAGGTITINGGTVTANGGYFAAGIGGGESGNGGTVTINRGTVEAHGGSGAAGIGGGGGGGAGVTVTINGGTVEAYGGSGAAGIGGGSQGVGGEVTINGGTVEAYGGSSAAGIGGGFYGAGGTVTITGGTVTATGGSGTEISGAGVGIGKGYFPSGGSDGNLTLTGVTMQVKDSEEASWESYVEDVRHRYMKADEGI